VDVSQLDQRYKRTPGLLTVDVSCASLVVTREEGVEGSNAVGVSRLDTTKCCSLQDGRIVRVTHARIALNTDVDTLK
jgi:hypothetical protein